MKNFTIFYLFLNFLNLNGAFFTPFQHPHFFHAQFLADQLEIQHRFGSLIGKKHHDSVPPLTVAASSGNVANMNTVLDAGADIDQLDWLGQTALHMACKFQQKEAVRILLKRGAKCCIANADFEETPLHLAAKTGSYDITAMLLDAGAQINAPISKHIAPGGTPLLYAAYYDGNSFTTAELLLQHGADVKATNSLGHSAIHLFAEQFNLRAVSSMISTFGTDPNLMNDFGCSPLNVLAMQKFDPGQIPIATYLLQNGAQVNHRCTVEAGSQRTPLHSAIANENYQLADVLIDYGAEVDALDRRGYTPLYYAVLSAGVHFEFVKLLLDAGANPSIRPNTTTQCNSMLSAFLRRKLPVDQNSAFIVAQLVKHGAKLDSNACPEDMKPLLENYLTFNRNQPISAPMSQRLKPKKASSGLIDLIKAASLGRVQDITAVYSDRFDNDTVAISLYINTLRDQFGRTALHWAVAGEYYAAAEMLLRGGAHVEVFDADGHSPLVYAAIRGNVELVKLLLSYGATPVGNAALKMAVDKSNSPEVVEILLQSGAKIDPSQELLHLATLKQNIRMMQILMAYGADVNAKSKENGQTPLSYLLDSDCCYPQLPVLTVLLHSEADFNSRDNKGRTPLAIAISVRRRRQVISYLLKHGANPNHPDNRGCNLPLYLLVDMAGTHSGRFHLHSIPGTNDDAEVALMAKDVLAHGAWPDRRDPCTNLTPTELAKRKDMPLTTKEIRQNMP